MAKKEKGFKDSVKVSGFFRLQINEDGKVVGDSGWRKNVITNDGFDTYVVRTLAALAGSKQVTYAMIGTGTAPGAGDTALEGEITDVAGMRCAVTPSTVASKTAQFIFTLASNVVTESKVIRNIGLINHSSTATPGTIFSGNTFTTSNLATNQAINGTYQIRFS